MLIVLRQNLMQGIQKLQIVNHVEVIVWYAQMVILALRAMMAIQ
jgi:hypothetical protein